MCQIAAFIDEVISDIENKGKIKAVAKKVSTLVKKFPLYKQRITRMLAEGNLARGGKKA